MKKLVVLNQKMYMDLDEVKDFIKAVKDKLRTDLNIVICPSSIYIPFFNGKYSFKLGSQNISGLFVTGEHSGKQLKSSGVTYAIIGHSERRTNFLESNNIVNLNIKEALDNNITPIVCVGESKEERDRRKTGEVILKQLKEGLKGIKVDKDLVIAYEPIWAIGTGVVPNNEEISEVINLIKDNIYKTHKVDIRVLYGGSVNDENIATLDRIKEVDGYLLGKASTDSKKILNLINQIK